MPNNNIVDSFNVEGQEYHIEPVIDPVPVENSLHAVASGGVFADKSNVPVQGSTKNFTAAGAFDFFANQTDKTGWLTKVFGPRFGRKWTQASNVASNAEVRYVGFVNGLWLVNIYGHTASAGLFWSTDKCATLTKTTGFNFSSDVSVTKIIYANNLWVAATSAGVIWSEDGKDWTRTQASMIGFCNDIVYAEGLFVVSAENTVRWSTDGNNYTLGLTLSSAANRAGQIVYANNTWVVATNKGAGTTGGEGIYHSTDGKNWTAATGNISTLSVEAIYFYEEPQYGTTKFWFAGTSGNGLWRSTNTQSWSRVGSNDGDVPDTATINSFIRANGLIIACGSGTFYTVGGLKWNAGVVCGGGYAARPLALMSYANGLFVARGTNTGVALSNTGVLWIGSNGFPGSTTVTSIAYGEGMWFAATYSKGLWRSGLEEYLSDD